MEIFTSEDAKKILWKKFVVVIGDSVQRCVYKDLVCLLVPDSNTGYLSTKELKAKGELEFLGDKLLAGGQLSEVKTGVNYREVRLYDSGTTLLKFYFVTRCFSEHVESVLNELKTIQPHIIVMNSCLWDLHRYGPRGPEAYRSNMNKLMSAIKKVIPNDAVFIWNATLPLASKCKGGLFLPYYESIPSQEIQEANFVACDVVKSNKLNFLDLHSIFRYQLHLRANDGIHWNSIAHRRVSNLILHQLCRSWNLPVPRTLPLLPTPPIPQPLLRASQSFPSHLDRYKPNSSNPYEFDSPVYDERYVVEKSMEDHASSYKDRFRLISTPVSSPINSSLPKPELTLENHPGLTPTLDENIPTPLYTSSPVEPSLKTKSFTDAGVGAACLSDIDYDNISEHRLRQILLLNQQLNRERKAINQSADNESLNTVTLSSTSATSRQACGSLPGNQLPGEPQEKEPVEVSQQMSSSSWSSTNCNNKENTPCNTYSISCVTPTHGTSSIESRNEVNDMHIKPTSLKPLTEPTCSQGNFTSSTVTHCQSESISQDSNVDKQSSDKSTLTKIVDSEKDTTKSTKSNVSNVTIGSSDLNVVHHSQSSKNHPRPEPSYEGVVHKTKEKGVVVVTKDTGEAVKAKETGEAVKAKETGEAVKAKEMGEAVNAEEMGEAVKVKDKGKAVKAKEMGEASNHINIYGFHLTMKTKGTGEAVKVKETGEAVKTKETGEVVKTKATGEAVKVKETGKAVKVKETGKAVKVKETGKAVKAKETGEVVKTKATGKAVKAKETGEAVKTKETGEAVKTKETGEAAKTKETGEAAKGKEKVTVTTSSSHHGRSKKRRASHSLEGTKNSKSTKAQLPGSKVVQKNKHEHSSSRSSVPRTSTSDRRGQKRKASDSLDSSRSSKSAKVEVCVGKVNQKIEVKTTSTSIKQSTSKTIDSLSAGRSRKRRGSDSSQHSKSSKGDTSKVVSTSSRSSTQSGDTVVSPIPVYTGFHAPHPKIPKVDQSLNKVMVNSYSYHTAPRHGHQRANSMTASIPVHSSLSAHVSQYPTYNTTWTRQPNHMTQAELAHHQMMVNNAIHRQRSYPTPLNPYVNSWDMNRGYYYHSNQRY